MWRRSSSVQTKSEPTAGLPGEAAELRPAEPALQPSSPNDDGGEGAPEKAVPEAATVAKETQPSVSLWRMSLVVTASALCGGIAVVLWNRRLLTKMREVVPVARSQQARLWEDDL